MSIRGATLTPEERAERLALIKEGKEKGLTWAQMGAQLNIAGYSLESWYNRRVRHEKNALSERACMCCKRPFESEGPHNRLCPECRLRRSISPWETVTGVSRRVGSK